eukprot:gene11921-8202_t
MGKEESEGASSLIRIQDGLNHLTAATFKQLTDTCNTLFSNSQDCKLHLAPILCVWVSWSTIQRCTSLEPFFLFDSPFFFLLIFLFDYVFTCPVHIPPNLCPNEQEDDRLSPSSPSLA